MITFFLILATLVFLAIAGVLGFYAYVALTDKSPDDFGVLSFIGLGMSAGCFVFVVLTVLGIVATVQQFRKPKAQPTVAEDCYTLEDSLAEHYVIGETARRYATTGRITVNGAATHHDDDLKQCLCDGDRIEIRLEHPPIKPDGTPADDKRSWTVERPNRNSFDAWMTEHCKTCKQCDESMNRNPDVGMCEVAFAKFQEYLRDQ